MPTELMEVIRTGVYKSRYSSCYYVDSKRMRCLRRLNPEHYKKLHAANLYEKAHLALLGIHLNRGMVALIYPDNKRLRLGLRLVRLEHK